MLGAISRVFARARSARCREMAKRNEALLEREWESAEQEQAFEATKAAVLATISHEFLTPLTVMMGATKTLERLGDRVTADARADLIHSLDVSAIRLHELVSSVLLVADDLGGQARTDGGREVVDLEEIAADVVSSLPGWERRVNVKIDGDVRHIVSDPLLLRPLMGQLVDNALKFSPADRPVEIAASLESDAVQICVQDRGPGIDPRFLDKATQPFTQGDASSTRTHGGLGIGLHLVHRMCGSLGGDLSLSPRPGGGTAAAVTLPVDPVAVHAVT